MIYNVRHPLRSLGDLMAQWVVRVSLIWFCFASVLAAQETPAGPAEVRSLEDLVAILEGDKINHDANLKEQYVVVPIEKDGLKAAQVIRWAANDGVVHFIQVIPLTFPKERIPAIESAMIRLNHSYPVPGLGLNHENNTPYFRLTVPLLPRKYLLENEVKEYFSYCVNQAINFSPTLSAIASGEVPPEKALEFQRSVIQRRLGPLGAWNRDFGGSVWILVINVNGEATLRRDGEVVVDTLVTVEGNKMTFNDVTGALAVETKGIYSFKVEGKTMSFTVVDDVAEGRKQVLGSGPWSR